MVPTKWGPAGALTLPPATGEEAPGTVYTCPMHPEVKSDKPGDCPKCGMKLQPMKKSAPAAAASTPATAPAERAASTAGTTYTCTMHPEVKQDRPGKCPKCGMDLVSKPNGRGADSSGSGGAR